jgi:hypothetical protein
MASRMQDPTGARGAMLFFARLDTALAILDDLSAHYWAIDACERVVRRGIKLGHDLVTTR